MTAESYFMAWVFYLLGVLGMMVVWFRITRAIKWQPLKDGLRVLVAALLFFPFSVGEGYSQLAPGILMVILETAFEGSEAFDRVGKDMIKVVGTALVISILYSVWRARSSTKSQQAASVEKPMATKLPVEDESLSDEAITPQR